ncbi:MAG: phosphoadenosine phosphosulfate reductase family protein [Clostridia bacterium]|nr:phosphoadenosine phosphosulfate reductase family protein [Clostridia bacterium]
MRNKELLWRGLHQGQVLSKLRRSDDQFWKAGVKMELKYTREQLNLLKNLPFGEKVKLTRQRIREWVEYWNGQVYVSFSGGKDSTVLLHLVRQMYPWVPAVFSNTGLEFPEVRRFALAHEGVEEIRPAKTFAQVVRTEGYPLISKAAASAIRTARRYDPEGKHRLYMTGHVQVPLAGGEMGRSMFDQSKWQKLAEEAPFRISDRCCSMIKKAPLAAYERRTGRHGIVGTMTEEGRLRERSWLVNGCNAYDRRHGLSTPMAFWREQDVLRYLALMHLEIAPVYGTIECIERPCRECRYQTTGADRTGCAFCGFGAHVERSGRFLRMRESHPKLYEYCIEGGEWQDNPDYDPSLPEYAADGFHNWNPPKLWMPSAGGLGMGYVFETVNALYGKTLIPF